MDPGGHIIFWRLGEEVVIELSADTLWLMTHPTARQPAPNKRRSSLPRNDHTIAAAGIGPSRSEFFSTFEADFFAVALRAELTRVPSAVLIGVITQPGAVL